MNRRLTILWLLCVWLSVSAQSTVRIWEDTGKGSSKVTLAEYLPDTPAETAVIVCPGGSYFWLDMETEGDSVARSLKAQGIAAYVLKYRTGGVVPFITHSRLVVSGHHHPMPLASGTLRRYLRQGRAEARLHRALLSCGDDVGIVCP